MSVRSGAKFSMPGMMDTVLNLGLSDRSVKGLAAQTGDDRFAYDSYRRFISMYGRIVLDIPAVEFDEPFEKAKAAAGVKSDAEIPAECARRARATSTRRGQEGDRRTRSRRIPWLSSVVQSKRCSAAGTAHAPIAYRVRERISHDLGTAVNVQAMVFGNRDDNSGTGVGFTRNAATGENKPYGDFLVNAQGEDVVAGIRNTEDLEALGRQVPRDLQGADGDLPSARDALPRHVRHRVHDRAGQALDAPDPRREAHRRRRAADGRRHDEGPAHQAVAGRCRHARHRRPSRPGAAPAARVEEPEGRSRPVWPRPRAPRSAMRTSPPTGPQTPPSAARR